MRRRVLPFVAVAAVAASVLTGCSAASQADTCAPTLSPGALSDSVKVSGDSADTLKVSFSKATEAANPQRSIVQQADSTSAERGTLVEEGMIFKANLAYVDAVTGEVLQVAPTFGTGEGKTARQWVPRGSCCCSRRSPTRLSHVPLVHRGPCPAVSLR